MSQTNGILLIVFGVIAYMMIVDPNVSKYITIQVNILKINFLRFLFMMKYHPNNFITTWIHNRKYDKIAREIEKEFKKSIDNM